MLTRLLWFFLSFGFALAQFQLVLVLYQGALASSLLAAKGVYEGTPHWVVYQNRILGPYVLEFLGSFLANPLKGYLVFFVAAQTLSGYLILIVSKAILKNENPLGPFFMFQALFSIIIVPHAPSPWIYVWDHLDILVFIIFFFLVEAKKDWRYFTGLFLIAIFNRESALFISLWMILDPMMKMLYQKPRKLDTKTLFAGLASMVGGIVLINYLRKILLVRETGPEIFHKPELAGNVIHFKLGENIGFIKQAIIEFGGNVDVTIVLFLMAYLVIIYLLARKNSDKYLALCATQLALFASIMLFAAIEEVRIHLELIPFIVLGTSLITERHLHRAIKLPS